MRVKNIGIKKSKRLEVVMPKLAMLFTLIAFTAVFGFGGFQIAVASTFTDFEPAGFVDGQSVNDLEPDGTTIVPPMSFGNSCREAWFVPTAVTDEEIVDLGADPHGKVWRMSTAVDSGSLGQNPHSPRNPGVISGESPSLPNDACGSSTTSNFYSQVDFRSVTGSAQPGLMFLIDANSSDTRQAVVQIVDNGASGFDLTYFPTANGCFFPGEKIQEGINLSPSAATNALFTDHTVTATVFNVSDLSYTDWHTLGIEIFFVPGLASGIVGQPGAEGNDIVNIYVNGLLVHTSTTWESCVGARVVDQLLFETRNEDISHDGNGLYFDNVLVTDVCPEGNCNGEGDTPGEGVLITFEVISGPNQGEMSDPGSGECTPNDDCTTDANGEVSWTYTGNGGLGIDTIEACFTNTEGVEICAQTVTKEWVNAPPPPPPPPAQVPTLSEWGFVAMAALLGIVGFMVIRRRKVTA